jgi:hypothetical protein
MMTLRRWITAFALLMLASCSSVPYGEVEGTVTLAGRPLPDVEVMFLPETDAGYSGPFSSGFTNESGRFRLIEMRSGRSGALVGIHRVCVKDLLANGTTPPRFPDEYTQTSATPLRDVNVEPGSQTYDLDLPARDRR